MIDRREFFRRVGWGLAAGYVWSRWSWPLTAMAGNPAGSIAVLADAHLPDGDARRPEAQALARAVAEIRALQPAPDVILFAGDLADGGDPRALALGKEILSDLPAPVLMVMGEGDGLADAAATWRRLFGEPWFSHAFQGSHLIGLHTAWGPDAGGPGFRVGEAGRRRLARELARLDPDTPLIILSHAPLAQIFHPWQQWTADAPEVARLLAPFRQVHCLHGHVHGAVASGQWSVVSMGAVSGQLSAISHGGERLDHNFHVLTENRKLKTENCLIHQGLPATSWPRPLALQGTPASPRPGLGPWGCGWGLVAMGSAFLHFQPHLWQA